MFKNFKKFVVVLQPKRKGRSLARAYRVKRNNHIPIGTIPMPIFPKTTAERDLIISRWLHDNGHVRESHRLAFNFGIEAL